MLPWNFDIDFERQGSNSLITGSPGGKPPRKTLYRDKNVEETGPDQQVHVTSRKEKNMM
jgi:hypothetical protein